MNIIEKRVKCIGNIRILHRGRYVQFIKNEYYCAYNDLGHIYILINSVKTPIGDDDFKLAFIVVGQNDNNDQKNNIIKKFISPFDILFPPMAGDESEIMIKKGTIFYPISDGKIYKGELPVHILDADKYYVSLPADIVERWQEYKEPIIYTEYQLRDLASYFPSATNGQIKADEFIDWVYRENRLPAYNMYMNSCLPF